MSDLTQQIEAQRERVRQAEAALLCPACQRATCPGTCPQMIGARR